MVEPMTRVLNIDSPLLDKRVLAVDDEPDILDTVAEELDMCIVDKVSSYDTALKYLLSYTYDVVILDIMGVNGFELLKTSVSRGFPTVIFTGHAVSPQSLKKSIRLGAVFFLPKEKIVELVPFLEDVVMGKYKQIWRKLFDRLGSYFDRQFGPDWKKRDAFFKAFEDELRKDMEADRKGK